jgi:hypothetical protein
MVELLAQAGAGIARHGFDLTDFGSPEKFQMVLRENGLLASYRRITHRSATDKTRRYYNFEWSNKRVKLITANNPLTGDPDVPGRRQKEYGYASYIGIEGEPGAVARVVASIKQHAQSIKDESVGNREYI